jgi:hypothetical protein
MKVPTDATKVFKPVAQNGGPSNPIVTNFVVDMSMAAIRGSVSDRYVGDRLRGSKPILAPNLTDAEYNDGTAYFNFNVSNTGIVDNLFGGNPSVWWNFQRAPGFFDEVCYTDDGTFQNIKHNLGVAPELIFVKSRTSGSWNTYCASFPNPATNYKPLNTDYASTFSDCWGTMTSTTFSIHNIAYAGGTPAVAYLFATCAGVSKVGSYTGNGSTQTINCGFTSGARFVLITKSTPLSTGDWYVYDTARGMTTLTDPYLLLNSTAAETATLGSVTTVSTGFALNSTILAAININAETYIFLAIA